MKRYVRISPIPGVRLADLGYQGLLEVSPIPSAEDLVSDLLRYLLDPSDEDRAFVPFSPEDDVALLINNFGGVSNFELEALTHVTLTLLGESLPISGP